MTISKAVAAFNIPLIIMCIPMLAKIFKVINKDTSPFYTNWLTIGILNTAIFAAVDTTLLLLGETDIYWVFEVYSNIIIFSYFCLWQLKFIPFSRKLVRKQCILWLHIAIYFFTILMCYFFFETKNLIIVTPSAPILHNIQRYCKFIIVFWACSVTLTDLLKDKNLDKKASKCLMLSLEFGLIIFLEAALSIKEIYYFTSVLKFTYAFFAYRHIKHSDGAVENV